MRDKLTKKTSFKQVRRFSLKVKQDMVRDIEKGLFTVLEASRELKTSEKTIYSWVYKYSTYLSKNKVLIIEDMSESSKTLELEKRLKEVEAALGRKQMELDLLNKVIELAGDELKIDLKKSFSRKVSNGIDKLTA